MSASENSCPTPLPSQRRLFKKMASLALIWGIIWMFLIYFTWSDIRLGHIPFYDLIIIAFWALLWGVCLFLVLCAFMALWDLACKSSPCIAKGLRLREPPIAVNHAHSLTLCLRVTGVAGAALAGFYWGSFPAEIRSFQAFAFMLIWAGITYSLLYNALSNQLRADKAAKFSWHSPYPKA